MNGRTIRPIAIAAVMTMAVFSTACGEDQKVGSEKLLEFEEQRGGGRLGEVTPPPKATPGSLTIDASRAPTTQPPKATEVPVTYFEITLVPNSPYYKPGNKMVIRRGVTIRVTNKDMTPERSKGRSFTDKHGTFHSGLLKPGATWTWRFSAPGAFEVIDEGLNFATAVLEVQ